MLIVSTGWVVFAVITATSFVSGLLSMFTEDEKVFNTLASFSRTVGQWAQIILGLLVAKHLGVF